MKLNPINIRIGINWHPADGPRLVVFPESKSGEDHGPNKNARRTKREAIRLAIFAEK
jgi:hypothetical protein